MVPFADFDGLFVGWFTSALLLEVPNPKGDREAHRQAENQEFFHS